MEKFLVSESIESRGKMGRAWKGDISIQSCGLLPPLITESVARCSNSRTFLGRKADYSSLKKPNDSREKSYSDLDSEVCSHKGQYGCPFHYSSTSPVLVLGASSHLLNA